MSKKDEFDYEDEFFGEENKEKHQEDSDYTWTEKPPAELTPMTYSEKSVPQEPYQEITSDPIDLNETVTPEKKPKSKTVWFILLAIVLPILVGGTLLGFLIWGIVVGFANCIQSCGDACTDCGNCCQGCDNCGNSCNSCTDSCSNCGSSCDNCSCGDCNCTCSSSTTKIIVKEQKTALFDLIRNSLITTKNWIEWYFYYLLQFFESLF